MIIQLQPDISSKQKETLIDKVNGIGYKTTEVKTQLGDYLIGIGKKDFDIRKIGQLDGIRDIHIVSDEYKLVSKKWKAKPTSVDLGDGVFIKDEKWRSSPAHAPSSPRSKSAKSSITALKTASG